MVEKWSVQSTDQVCECSAIVCEPPCMSVKFENALILTPAMRMYLCVQNICL